MTIDTQTRELPAISIVAFGCKIPEFGLTQYLFGAVVLILKQTLCSDGFFRVMNDVIGAFSEPSRNKNIIKKSDNI